MTHVGEELTLVLARRFGPRPFCLRPRFLLCELLRTIGYSLLELSFFLQEARRLISPYQYKQGHEVGPCGQIRQASLPPRPPNLKSQRCVRRSRAIGAYT